MGNLTKRDRRMLEDILLSMRKAETFIKRDSTFVCTRNSIAMNSKGTISKGNIADICINKEIGSDLCYLYNAIRALDNFLIED